jgi:predicted aldo/keto reductase-like oxidoreductase
MQTVQLDIGIESLDSVVIQRLQESAETLAECIKQDIIRASMATKPSTAYVDIDDQIRMIRKMNSVLEYFGGDPVDWTGYK